ncbi:Lyso-phosphatidylcholine acyltransferase [Parahypoxylon ruwenzoriense]
MASDQVDMPKSNPNRLPLKQPSLPWRMTSSIVMGLTAALSRSFLYGLNSVEVIGLERFLDVLDKRKDVDKRQRGLITVSNHISVLLETFFSSGQVLPTHRLKHSLHGGPFQSTIPQAIRLLSSPPFVAPRPTLSEETRDVHDPFTSAELTYTTTGTDQYVAPSIYSQNRYSWVHIFPEACVHQHPKMFLRYFKWGISRMILESEPVPDVLPMFIDGTQHIMPEDRKWPRFLPRFPVKFRVAFGDLVDTEKTFGDLRARWQELVRREKQALVMGELTDELKYGREAVNLRIEVARRVRDEVMKVRKSMGYPDEEEPGFELAETWAREPSKDKFRSNVDDSLVNKRD